MSEIEFEKLEELSDEAFEVEEYNHHEFEDLYFDPDAIITLSKFKKQHSL